MKDVLTEEEEKAPSEKSQVVQMRLQPKTLNRLQNLADITQTSNKTQLVSSAIELTEEIVKNLKLGSKIYIETADGKKETLKIIGI